MSTMSTYAGLSILIKKDPKSSLTANLINEPQSKQHALFPPYAYVIKIEPFIVCVLHIYWTRPTSCPLPKAPEKTRTVPFHACADKSYGELFSQRHYKTKHGTQTLRIFSKKERRGSRFSGFQLRRPEINSTRG